MGLETANFIEGLDESWPTGLDPINQGDDHTRLVKGVLKTQFPGAGGQGFNEAIIATEVELNFSSGVTSSIQDQLNSALDGVSQNALGINPIGAVIMFNASFASIPANWQLCDGTSGTPDMTDRFVYGTNTEGELEAIGGSADAVVVSHTHTANAVGDHTHSFTAQQNIGGFTDDGGAPDQQSTSQSRTTAGAGGHNHTINSAGVSGTDKNLPPYVKLAYIQRMS